MTAQQIFYIIASIALGALFLFLLAAATVLFTLKREITSISRKMHFVADEAHSLFRNGTKYFSASMGAGLFAKIIKSLRHRS